MTEKVEKGDCLKEICDQLAKCQLDDPQSVAFKCLLDSIVKNDFALSDYQKLCMKQELLCCLIEKLCVETKKLQEEALLNEGLRDVLSTNLSTFRVIKELFKEMMPIIADKAKK